MVEGVHIVREEMVRAFLPSNFMDIVFHNSPVSDERVFDLGNGHSGLIVLCLHVGSFFDRSGYIILLWGNLEALVSLDKVISVQTNDKLYAGVLF